jgi:hypothetical protein
MGRRRDWVRWKDMLETVERAPKVLCEELKEARECCFLGDGVIRRLEDMVLL